MGKAALDYKDQPHPVLGELLVCTVCKQLARRHRGKNHYCEAHWTEYMAARCNEMVNGPGRWGWVHQHQCERVGTSHNGKQYCKSHMKRATDGRRP